MFKLKKKLYIGIAVAIVILLLGYVVAATQINDQKKIDEGNPEETVVPEDWKEEVDNTPTPTRTPIPPETPSPEDLVVYDVFIDAEIHITPVGPPATMSIDEVPIGVYYLIYGTLKYEKSSFVSSLRIVPHRITLPSKKLGFVYNPPGAPTRSPTTPPSTTSPPTPSPTTPPEDPKPPYDFKIVLIVDGVELKDTVTDSYKFDFALAKLRNGEHTISFFIYLIIEDEAHCVAQKTIKVDLTGEKGEYDIDQMVPIGG